MPTDQFEPNSRIRKNVMLEGLTNKSELKLRTRGSKLVAGAEDEGFKTHMACADAREMNAPISFAETSGAVNAQRFAQHIYTNMPVSTGSGTENHAIADNMRGENGIESWRRQAPSFDPTSAQANVNVMSKTLKPPKGNIDNRECFIENGEERVRRQDERIGRQAMTDDTTLAMVMDMCLVDIERHLVLDFGRHDTYPKLKPAMMDCVEQTRHKPDPMDIDEMSRPHEEEHDGAWEDVYAVGISKGNGKGKNNDRGKLPCKGGGKRQPGKQRARNVPSTRGTTTGRRAARPRSAPKRKRRAEARRATTAWAMRMVRTPVSKLLRSWEILSFVDLMKS